MFSPQCCALDIEVVVWAVDKNERVANMMWLTPQRSFSLYWSRLENDWYVDVLAGVEVSMNTHLTWNFAICSCVVAKAVDDTCAGSNALFFSACVARNRTRKGYRPDGFIFSC